MCPFGHFGDTFASLAFDLCPLCPPSLFEGSCVPGRKDPSNVALCVLLQVLKCLYCLWHNFFVPFVANWRFCVLRLTYLEPLLSTESIVNCVPFLDLYNLKLCRHRQNLFLYQLLRFQSSMQWNLRSFCPLNQLTLPRHWILSMLHV